jgi:putative ABC transport system permease protein
MLKHDLTLALRRLLQQRFHTAVGVAVLTLGLVCFLAANLFVSYVRNYDRHWPNADRTYIVAERMSPAGFGSSPLFATTSDGPIAEHLRLDAPELAAVARAYAAPRVVSAGEQRVPFMVGYVEAQFTEIFELAPLAGDIGEALATPRSVVLTRRAAERLFGTVDVAGRSVALAVQQQPVDVTIKAVVADFPSQSHLNQVGLFSGGFDVLVSWDVLEAFERPNLPWGANVVKTYALLPTDGSLTVDELDRRLSRIAAERVPEDYKFLNVELEARSVSDFGAMTLQRQFQGFWGRSVWVDILAALRTAAAVILALACLNFVNLAIAQSSVRVLDIGTRKVLGATTLQIVRQDLLQSSLVVLLALALAIATIVPLGQAFAAPWSLSLELPWNDPRFFTLLGATLLGVTFAAGLYPAILLSRVRRAAALRLGRSSDALAWVRGGLVGFEFAVASTLVAAAVVLLLQKSHLREALMGRLQDQYVAVFINAGQPIDPDVIGTELMRGRGIIGTTAKSGGLFDTQQRRFARTRDEASPRAMLDFVYTGHDYFAVMDMPLVVGRAFDRARADDVLPRGPEWTAREARPPGIVLDAEAARALGWPEPAAAVGETIYAPGGGPHTIIGVVERAPLAVRDSGATGTAYVLAPWTVNIQIVRIASDRVDVALAHIDETMRALFPGRPPPARRFFDQVFEEDAYATFELTNRVLTGLAGFALFISGIGLFGMASYIANRRTREIGIRKVQGATPASILRLLLWDFSKPVAWANLLAWPLVLIAIDRYLIVFAERVAITPLPFAVALATTWLLACLAIGGCAWRAAKLHPAEALRQ